jgi:hypothetical protein
MDYNFIEQAAGKDVTDKLHNDSYCDSILERSHEIDALDLDRITRGAIILGVEPVDYPITDGLYIYVKQPGGRVVSLYVEENENARELRTAEPGMLWIREAAID